MPAVNEVGRVKIELFDGGLAEATIYPSHIGGEVMLQVNGHLSKLTYAGARALGTLIQTAMQQAIPPKPKTKPALMYRFVDGVGKGASEGPVLKFLPKGNMEGRTGGFGWPQNGYHIFDTAAKHIGWLGEETVLSGRWRIETFVSAVAA